MRPEIRRLVELGKLPSKDNGDIETPRNYEIEYRGITKPIIDEEAIALLGPFEEDALGSLHRSCTLKKQHLVGRYKPAFLIPTILALSN